MSAQFETEKRLKLAAIEVANFQKLATGIILTGSVAYAPYQNVTSQSDIDLVIIAKQVKDFISFIPGTDTDRMHLKNRFFEGYCFKKVIEEIPISYHIISEDAFDIIVKCFVADIRVFRLTAKVEEYDLFGFERNRYSYKIKNILLNEFNGQGFRTIVPVGFINNDRYFLGIHRDKLLSTPNILFDPHGKIEAGIEKLWFNVCHNLCDESYRLFGGVDDRMTIINMLAKSNKMSESALAIIKKRTSFYLANCLSSRI